MENSKIVDILMDLQQKMASIDGEQKNINKRLDNLAKQQELMNEVQKDLAGTKANVHFIWILFSAFIIFCSADILAPTIVNWLSTK